MPFAGATEFQIGQMVTAAETHARIEQALGPLVPVNSGKLDGEASTFHLPGASGTIGFIYSISAPFCEYCNRARLTADGKLRTCLLREYEVDLLTPLRNGASQEELQKMIMEAIYNKPWGMGWRKGKFRLTVL